jgi:hypothetical protein
VTSTPKDTQKKTTLGDADITSVRTQTRRTFLRRTGMASLAIIGAGSDSDVNDPYGAGSDNDANDPYGAGTDYDVAPSSSSSDAVGYGTDYDPSDAVGSGTDAD